MLFADLVDFTPHTLTMPPGELVQLLDRIFTAFDQRTEVCGLEKIKTSRRTFLYDSWGDPGNAASRMQTSGLSGQIQVTSRVAAAMGACFLVRRTARALLTFFRRLPVCREVRMRRAYGACGADGANVTTNRAG